jgi:RNA polymerase sigma-70 factor (ECF subfamily)
MPERPPDDLSSLAGRLYDEYGSALYRYAAMILADTAAAEDAVQQVFAALLRLGARAAAGKDVHYLRRAVRNECYSILRRRKTRTAVGLEPILEARVGADPEPEMRLAIERALHTLPAEQREVVHLHAFEGLTFQEIADACGESINTVASRYRYALAKLKDVLSQAP